MAVCNLWNKASQQDMDLRRQADSEHPTVMVQRQHQIALVAVQVLEHQRLASTHHQNQQLERQPNLLTQIRTLYSTEGN